MDNKHAVLNDFLISNADLPQQGTDEWLHSRRGRIGGSEISTILNKNPYQNVKKLITQRVGLSEFKGFYATYWGTVFENNIRDYINELLNCNIVETGSIPHSEYSGLAYSPDGLSVVNTELLNNVLICNNKNICDTIKDTTDSIILFEFKCPHSRVPTGNIPVYYVDQPRMGMNVIDICEMALFIEAVFKLVSYEDILYNNKYNYNYHKDKVIIDKNPIKCGVMILYFKRKIEEHELDDIVVHTTKNEIVKLLLNIKKYYRKNTKHLDISSLSNSYNINKVLELLASNSNILKIDNSISHTYAQPGNTNMSKYKDMMLRSTIESNVDAKIESLESEGYTIFGIVPYKLFDLYINPILKDQNFLTDELKEDIDKVLAVIKECQSKTNDDKINIINTFVKSFKKK